MSGGQAHGHGGRDRHDHGGAAGDRRRLAIVLALTATVLAVQVVGAALSGGHPGPTTLRSPSAAGRGRNTQQDSSPGGIELTAMYGPPQKRRAARRTVRSLPPLAWGRARGGGQATIRPAVQTCQQVRLGQDLDRQGWGDAYEAHDLVFARENGAPLRPEYVTRRFVALTKAAGLRPVRLHDLRHGAASLMLAAGVPMAIVSKMLRHSSIGITVDT